MCSNWFRQEYILGAVAEDHRSSSAAVSRCSQYEPVPCQNSGSQTCSKKLSQEGAPIQVKPSWLSALVGFGRVVVCQVMWVGRGRFGFEFTRSSSYELVCLHSSVRPCMPAATVRETDRETERQRDREAGRHRGRETERQRDRETESQRDKETHSRDRRCLRVRKKPHPSPRPPKPTLA